MRNIVVVVGLLWSTSRVALADAATDDGRSSSSPFFQLGLGYADLFTVTDVAGLTASAKIFQGLTDRLSLVEAMAWTRGTADDGLDVDYFDVSIGLQVRPINGERTPVRSGLPYKFIDWTALRLEALGGVAFTNWNRNNEQRTYPVATMSLGYSPLLGHDYSLGVELRGKAVAIDDDVKLALDYLVVVDLLTD